MKVLGARKVKEDLWVLDEFDTWMYLVFDTEFNPEDPASKNTCDVFVSRPGCFPSESCDRIQIMKNANEEQIAKLLLALGIERFSKETQEIVKAKLSVQDFK